MSLSANAIDLDHQILWASAALFADGYGDDSRDIADMLASNSTATRIAVLSALGAAQVVTSYSTAIGRVVRDSPDVASLRLQADVVATMRKPNPAIARRLSRMCVAAAAGRSVAAAGAGLDGKASPADVAYHAAALCSVVAASAARGRATSGDVARWVALRAAGGPHQICR